ncbi:MAG TPA: dicarboxylate/amino acid:cation symporter [Alphaproteobacteria bacterium]|nr:dicarboxylate/amino acid:cation symporter [Alphaproteobacteria bacterium]
MPQRHAVVILILIALGVAAGAITGWLFGQAMTAIAWLGQLFLDALKMLIVPLIVAAVVSGVASLGDVRRLGRIGALTIFYFLATTMTAVLIGLVLVNLFEPGAGLSIESGTISESLAAKQDIGFSDILLSLVTPNLVAAAAETQVLPLMLFAIALAAALTTLGTTGEPVIRFFHGLNEAMMKLVGWLMYLAPIGIFALVAARLGKAGGGEAFVAELESVGLYVLTVLAGLLVHTALLILILVVLGGRGISFILGMMRALLTAFGTASSSATLPLTMECAREQEVDERTVRFVLPLGSTLNMNGTALYEAVAVMFIAQAYGLDLSLGQQIVVLVTATLAAIGAAGIPEAGLVTMVIVLNAVGLPLEGIGLLLAVDWFLDRFRTTVNVWGDAVGATVIGRRLPPASEPAAAFAPTKAETVT